MAKSKTERVFAEVFAVAELHPVQGIDMARLALALAGLPRQEQVVGRVLAELVEHTNPSRRRIGIHACRRAKRFQAAGLRDALVRRLADPDPWVRYDAAWTIHEAGYDGPDVRAALDELAAGVSLSRDRKRLTANPSNAELAGRVRAREALDALPAVAEPVAAADGGGV